MDKKAFARFCGMASQRNLPLLLRHGKAIELGWTEPPRPRGSFGLLNDWVAVRRELRGAFATLIIPFDPERLGPVKRDTIRIFRFDAAKSSFGGPVASVRHAKLPVVYATIELPGTYGLIGLHAHPLVRDTIRLLCEMRPLVRSLPDAARGRLRDRTCDLILCAADMARVLDSRTGPADPVSPTLPRPAAPGETLCDRCHGVDILDFPDCHVLEPLTSGPCAPVTWENIGPKHISGVIRQILVDPTSRRRLYAVSANGGIWRLSNVDDYPNTTWRPLTDDLVNLRFRAMAIAPSDGRVLYAANVVKELWALPNRVYSEIYRSDNRGSDWTPVHQAGMGVVHRIVIHPANPDVVFAASSTGLWRQSTTIGAWTNLFPDDCLDVALDLDDASIVYLGVRNRGLFKSFTSGGDWSASPILAVDPVAASDDPTTAAVESNRQAIRIALGRLNSSGTPQTPIARTVVARFGNEINVSPASGDDPAGWRRQVVFVSDGNDPPGNRALALLTAGVIRRSDTPNRRANEWCNSLAVDPFDPDHLLVGAAALFESTDGGQTWTLLDDTPNFLHEDHHGITFDEEQQGLVYVVNDGGAFSGVFSAAQGRTLWPSMGLAHTSPAAGRGTNLAMGLITSEVRHSAVRGGRCVAAIDHTGYVLSEDFSFRWQFLFDGPDRSAAHGGHENSYVFSCSASPDRWYIFNMRRQHDPLSTVDDPTTAANERQDVLGRLAQFDFARTNGLVDPPARPFAFLSDLQAPVFEPHVAFLFGQYAPEHLIHDGNMPGPFAIRYSEAANERLILFATVAGNSAPFTFNIQSIRLAGNGTTVTATAAEAADSTVPFFAITFVPQDPDRAFGVTQTGQLFERDFADPGGQFAQVSQWALPAGATVVSTLVPVASPDWKLYLLSQNSIGRYDDDGQPVATIYSTPDPNERLMSLVADPSRDDTLFLGTSRGVHISEDGGITWRPYHLGMPAVPITGLSFDQGYLYAATFGRGLWRCRPCR